MTSLEVKQERMILVAVAEGREEEAVRSLHELRDLAQTAGVEVVESVIQNREHIHPSTYVGKGKIEELQGMLYYYDADGNSAGWSTDSLFGGENVRLNDQIFDSDLTDDGGPDDW